MVKMVDDDASVASSSASSISQSKMGDSVSSASGTGRSTKSGTSSSSWSLAREESRAVRRSRMIVLGVIAAAALLVAGLSYMFVANGEEHSFRQSVCPHIVSIVS
jgi:hypothetical protein